MLAGCHIADAGAANLRMIRVIAKLRHRQLNYARKGRLADSARYAKWVQRICRGSDCA